MKKSILVFASLFLFSFYGYAAQSIGFYAPKQGFNKYNQLGLAHGPALGGKPTMALKWNITAAAFSNINLSYEYFIAPKISLQLGFGFTPSSGVPLKDFFYSTINRSDVDSIRPLDSLTHTGWSLAIEPRFYLGKKANAGFYLSPTVRYGSYTFDGLVSYLDNGTTKRADFSGTTLKSTSYGLAAGYQIMIAEKFIIDLSATLLGQRNFNIHAEAVGQAGSLNQSDFQDIDKGIRDAVSNFNGGGYLISVKNEDVSTNIQTNSASFDVKGSMALARFGISIGYAF